MINCMMKDFKDSSFEYMDCVDWDSNSDQKSQNREGPLSFEASNHSPIQKKPSFKNKYINKIKQSYKDYSTSSRRRRGSTGQEILHDQQTVKKFKNKVAAKESRDRKKMYIRIIERQTRALEEELSKVNKELEDCKAEILRTAFASSQNIGGSFTAKMSHVSKKLKRLTAQEETDQSNNQINLTIDSLCYRFAAMGKERRGNINEGYRQIINLGVPTPHRYILWAASQDCHMFSSNQGEVRNDQEAWFDEMRPILGDLSENNSISIYKDQIKEMYEKLVPVLGKLVKAKGSMEILCQNVDQLFLQIREIITPIQLAKFLLFQETYRYRQELLYHEKIWLQGQEEQLDKVKKHIKLNQQ